jgi:hypothetical protein
MVLKVMVLMIMIMHFSILSFWSEYFWVNNSGLLLKLASTSNNYLTN